MDFSLGTFTRPSPSTKNPWLSWSLSEPYLMNVIDIYVSTKYYMNKSIKKCFYCPYVYL